MDLNSVWQVFLVAGALAALAFLIAAIRRWPIFALFLALIQVVVLQEFPNSISLGSVGGASVSVLDVYAAAIFFAFLIGIREALRSAPVRWFIMFALIVGASTVVGVAVFGFASVNEARPFIWMIACLLWSSTLDWQDAIFRDKVFRLLVFIGWLLVLVAVYHLAIRGFGGYGDDFVDADGETVDRRALASGQALILVLSGIAAVSLARRAVHRNWVYLSVAAFAVVVIVSQQRTIWVVAVAALAIGLMFDRRRSFSTALWAIAGSTVVLVVIATGVADGLLSALGASLQDNRTLIGRESGWSSLIGQALDKGPAVTIFGAPFGSGYEREELGRIATYSPHNWYVTVFLRTGVLGLAFYMIAMLVALARLLRSRASLFATLVIVSIGIYSWTYSASWYAAIFLGCAFAIVARRPPKYVESGEEPALVSAPKIAWR